jgi:hypothetical protein
MSSRDGKTFHRWPEAFLRPGPRQVHNWAYGDNYVAWHAVETAASEPGMPRELSLYASEGYWIGSATSVRRYALRIDGFVSLHAPMQGGEVRTRPLRFSGERLLVNFSTSAAGSIRVGLHGEDGAALEGYSTADCPEIFGDQIERTVKWQGGADLSAVEGKVVRLRFLLKDADLYSFRFAAR